MELYNSVDIDIVGNLVETAQKLILVAELFLLEISFLENLL